MHLYFDFLLMIQVHYWGSTFGGTWEDVTLGVNFFKFAVKQLIQGKLQFIRYFRREWIIQIMKSQKNRNASLIEIFLPGLNVFIPHHYADCSTIAWFIGNAKFIVSNAFPYHSILK